MRSLMTQTQPSADTAPTTSPDTIRIMIADDHPVVCFGLLGIIRTQPDMTVVAEAKNGKEAVALFREYRPDVTLMDLRMPEMGGVEAIHLMRQEDKKCAVIVLTTYHGDEEIRRALGAGAQAYVLKGMSATSLDAIRSVPPDTSICRGLWWRVWAPSPPDRRSAGAKLKFCSSSCAD